MQQAADELTACRVTLKWSYAMAYFLSTGNQKQIFEDIQACVHHDSFTYVVAVNAFDRRDLEKAVEALSQLLEEPIEEGTVKALRSRIVDKTVRPLLRYLLQS